MIVALDHTLLICPDLDSASAELTLLLGRPPVWKTHANEVGTALFLVDNTALELMAPMGAGGQADRLRQIVANAGGPTLTTLFLPRITSVMTTDVLADAG